MKKYPLRNVFTHLWGTAKHKFWVSYFILEFIVELIKRAFLHDLSKYSSHERQSFFKVIHRLRTLTYGSPEYQECLDSVQPALKHHYKKNPHHPEHYSNGINGFSLVDLVEMFCDWKAAVLRHENGDIKVSIKVNKERFGMSDQLCEILENSTTSRK